jgi:hypothetical protein
VWDTAKLVITHIFPKVDVRILSLRSRRQNRAWGEASAEPQERRIESHQARERGRQRVITDTFRCIQYHSLPKILSTRLGKIFSDDALSVAQCNPALSQRSID